MCFSTIDGNFVFVPFLFKHDNNPVQIFPVWCRSTDSTEPWPQHIWHLWMNWTTHSEPDMISQHQYWTSLMLLWLNGSESLQQGSTSAGKTKTMPVLSMLSVHALMGIFSMCLLHSFVLVFGMVTSSAANRSMSWKAEEKICWQTCLTCPNNFRTGLDDLTDNETFVLSFFHVFMALESEFKYIYVNIQSSLTLQARLF